MTLKEYWQALSSHDWHYWFSDDRRAMDAGEENQKRLMTISKISPEHAALFQAWHAHEFSGGPWKTEKQPKPEEPAE